MCTWRAASLAAPATTRRRNNFSPAQDQRLDVALGIKQREIPKTVLAIKYALSSLVTFPIARYTRVDIPQSHKKTAPFADWDCFPRVLWKRIFS